MKNAIDQLIEKIKQTNNPTVLGLDPRYHILPTCLTSKYPQTITGACKAILEFNQELINATYDIIPAVKPQIAFYEMFGVEGIQTFQKTCEYAKQKGMIVIADSKRGDIGSTAEGYSSAFLGKTTIGQQQHSIFDVEFITLNPYQGIDAIKPFLEDAKKYGKGMFILLKTSNPSSSEIQDLITNKGTTIYQEVAKLVNQWGQDLIGENGYSAVSAVVGATQPIQLQELRQILPHTYFLIPGYGAQGGKAKDIALGFDSKGLGGIVNASRSLMCAYQAENWKQQYTQEQFAQATRQEAIRMRDELNQAIQENIKKQ